MLLPLSFSKNYMTGPAELLFNDKTTGVKGINLVFDSGSSYTYFNAEAYQAILNLVRENFFFEEKRRKKISFTGCVLLQHCYD